MSRIGKKIIDIPEGVNVTINESEIHTAGPKGELSCKNFSGTNVVQENNQITISPVDESQASIQYWGIQRTLLNNNIVGVTEGYKKTLEINGVGYKAQMKGNNIQLSLGFSHDINYEAPEGIKIETSTPTEVIVSGIDKQKVGQVAAEIRSYRPPEPYKGKGVKYKDEFIFRKEGKKK
ncbi:MAG: 50S ribosomal protein L6 [Alphaproteobacteria bacterium]|jgi:large subunit ribosomal protein L6|nr:50S ribosomal protein L6 [Alphaproteobacteria bacterium]